MSSPKITAPKPHSWMAAALRRRWVRLSLLVGVLVFEFAFIWFITQFGWLESVNIWTQLAVIFLAVLPLLVAAFSLVRKRFSLTSAFVAFTMFAVFMGFTMRPVYEARQARATGKLLTESGVRIDDRYNLVDWSGEYPRFKYHKVDEKPLSDWMSRLIGDQSKFPLEDEIHSLGIDSNEQMEIFASVASRLSNVEILRLGPDLSAECAVHEAAIIESGVSFLDFGGHQSRTDFRDDLNWIANCKNVRSLGMWNVSNGANKVIESVDLGIEGLHLGAPPLAGKLPLEELVNSETVRNLKMLAIHGWDISDDEAQHFLKLENLKSLLVSFDSLDGFSFLHQMPNLRYARIQSLGLTAGELEKIKIPANLKEFHLGVSGTLISESELDAFKTAAPKGCQVSVWRQ